MMKTEIPSLPTIQPRQIENEPCCHQRVSKAQGVITKRFCSIARGKPLTGHVLDEVSIQICEECPLYNTTNITAGTRVTQVDTYGDIVVPSLHTLFAKPQLFASGEIVYPKLTWEPPPLIPGYRRKSSNLKHRDAWTLIPDQEKCIHSKLELKVMGNCKCERFVLSCTLGQPAEPITSYTKCNHCPNKSLGE